MAWYQFQQKSRPVRPSLGSGIQMCVGFHVSFPEILDRIIFRGQATSHSHLRCCRLRVHIVRESLWGQVRQFASMAISIMT